MPQFFLVHVVNAKDETRFSSAQVAQQLEFHLKHYRGEQGGGSDGLPTFTSISILESQMLSSQMDKNVLFYLGNKSTSSDNCGAPQGK